MKGENIFLSSFCVLWEFPANYFASATCVSVGLYENYSPKIKMEMFDSIIPLISISVICPGGPDN